ncbi:MAG: hypothetical protein Q7R94_01610 [bacterium]|nr:hypothetical protein [bacterium]
MFVRQAAEFDHALERNDCEPDFVKWLSTGSNLTDVRSVYLGYSEIKAIDHVIDTDATPKMLIGWKIEEHRGMGRVKIERRGGDLYANGKKVVRFLSPNQKGGKVIKGHKLREELAKKPVLNAVVRDYLREHPELIPEEWKNGATYFWGSIFRDDSTGYLYVTGFDWHDGQWRWIFLWLASGWFSGEPAALLASS